MGPVPQEDVVPTRIAFREGSAEHTGQVTNQSVDGKVYIRHDDDGRVTVHDLSQTRYRWL